MAAQKIEYTSPEGLRSLELLYQHLHVPLAAMVAGVQALEVVSTRRLGSQHEPLVKPYFDHLLEHLKRFQQ
jgi:hypothetical protein